MGRTRNSFQAGWLLFTFTGIGRCLIDDEDGEAVITVDDHELTMEQFGRLLTSHAGWGMRLVFVPDDEIDQPPRVEVREPKEDHPNKGNGRGKRT